MSISRTQALDFLKSSEEETILNRDFHLMVNERLRTKDDIIREFYNVYYDVYYTIIIIDMVEEHERPIYKITIHITFDDDNIDYYNTFQVYYDYSNRRLIKCDENDEDCEFLLKLLNTENHETFR